MKNTTSNLSKRNEHSSKIDTNHSKFDLILFSLSLSLLIDDQRRNVSFSRHFSQWKNVHLIRRAKKSIDLERCFSSLSHIWVSMVISTDIYAYDYLIILLNTSIYVWVYICHRSRCACYCKHTSIDVHLRTCNGTFKHLGALKQLLACSIL